MTGSCWRNSSRHMEQDCGRARGAGRQHGDGGDGRDCKFGARARPASFKMYCSAVGSGSGTRPRILWIVRSSQPGRACVCHTHAKPTVSGSRVCSEQRTATATPAASRSGCVALPLSMSGCRVTGHPYSQSPAQPCDTAGSTHRAARSHSMTAPAPCLVRARWPPPRCGTTRHAAGCE